MRGAHARQPSRLAVAAGHVNIPAEARVLQDDMADCHHSQGKHRAVRDAKIAHQQVVIANLLQQRRHLELLAFCHELRQSVADKHHCQRDDETGEP